MLLAIRSGGQTGADLGSVIAAKKHNMVYGMLMPKGFLNETGYHPKYAKEYNAKEHYSEKYPPRTGENVAQSDGTIRFASSFKTAGEKCTLNFINHYNKEHIDVDVNNPILVSEVVDWIFEKKIRVLNVAGNRESTSPGIERFVEDYMINVIELCNARID